MKNSSLRYLTPGLALAVFSAGVGRAGTAQMSAKESVDKNVVEPLKEKTWCEKLFGLATIYKGDDSDWLNEFAITGRYHGQFWAADSETGSDEDWENRRFRIGARAVLFQKKLELKAEIFSNLDNDDDGFYDGFTDLHARVMIDPAFNITIGKQKPKYGWEWTTSSRVILTFERSQLSNQFRGDYAPGVSIDGKVDKWSYYGGVFASDPDEEFGDFDGGTTAIASVGYDLKEAFGVDKALWRLDFMYTDQDDGDTIFNWFDTGVSTSLEFKQGQWGLNAEAQYGSGQSDAFGIMIQPYYDITKKLQVVASYQFAWSDEDEGLRPQSRYEREVGGTNGDLYNAIYAGLNYYICEHKLKLMGGVEYANMDGGSGPGYDGWTAFAGVRVYW
ncbi:MAG: porin [Verrucomicrobiales bacterium]